MRRRGSALMEVVIALSILVVAMGVVGFAFRNGELNLDRSERITRAMLLTEQVLTNVDLGLIDVAERAEAGQAMGTLSNVSGEFGVDAPPGMSYWVGAEADDNLPGVIRLYVEIFAGGADDESKRLILATTVLRAPPRAIDLEADFGLQPEQTQKLQESIPGGAAFFDPKAFDPREIASMDMDTLVEMLPMIMEALGGGMLAGRMDDIMQAVQSGNVQQLQDIAKDAAPGGMMPNPGLIPPGGQGGQPRRGGR